MFCGVPRHSSIFLLCLRAIFFNVTAGSMCVVCADALFCCRKDSGDSSDSSDSDTDESEESSRRRRKKEKKSKKRESKVRAHRRLSRKLVHDSNHDRCL